MASASENKDFIDAVFGNWPLDEAIGWIQSNLTAEEVFGSELLSEWAEDNGYTMEED